MSAMPGWTQHAGWGVSQQGADPIGGCDAVVDPDHRCANRDRDERQRLIGPHNPNRRFPQFGERIGVGCDGSELFARDERGVAELIAASSGSSGFIVSPALSGAVAPRR